MKKIFAMLIALCFCANMSFAAFDPYADEEIEKKSYKKLYYGIALTLLGGFLAYDGFSKEKVDVSKPSVDYTTVLHSEWSQDSSNFQYDLKSGYSTYKYKYDSEEAYVVEKNAITNIGNVDLEGLKIEVRYRYGTAGGGGVIGPGESQPDTNGTPTSDGYHNASNLYIKNNNEFSTVEKDEESQLIEFDLAVGETKYWSDYWEYGTASSNSPSGDQRKNDESNTAGLHLGKEALEIMDIRVVLKNKYTKKYETKNKSDIEGVAGIMIGATGIYFLVDHFLDMHKFNVYAKKHDLNFKIATAPNEYKLMLQKRI